MFQAVINTLLLFWAYEEYQNNIYFQAYLNDQVATAGWMIGLAALLLVLGSVTFVMLHRNKSVTLDVTGIEPLPARPKMPSASRVAVPTNPTKPTESFHPVVAALKAELHGTPAPFGALLPRTTPGAMTLQTPAQSFEDKTGPLQNKTPVLRIQGAIPNTSQTTVATGQTPPSAIPSTVVTSAISKKPEKEGPAEQKPSN